MKYIAMAASSESVSMASSENEDSKLWIGNLDGTVTEYQLLQILKKVGNIEKFEFLFHLHGQLKGKPKGYCFVKFETNAESENAIRKLNGLQLESKRIIVDWARTQQVSIEQNIPVKKEEVPNKVGKDISKESKIRAIEKKLRLMEQGFDTSLNNPLIDKFNSNRRCTKKIAHPYKQRRRKSHRR